MKGRVAKMMGLNCGGASRHVPKRDGAMKIGVVRYFMHFDGSKTGVASILRCLLAIYLRGNTKAEHRLPHNYKSQLLSTTR